METQFIKKTIEKILEYLSPESELKAEGELQGGEILKFSIETSEPYVLIGEEGKSLMAINHLVKKICETEWQKQGAKTINFIVDVNDYQERRIQDIKNKAQIMAERARFFKSDVELTPMNPYERMIVHTFFSNAEDLKTESTGYGRERRVVIKYVAV